jgi:hypothetical protein
LKACLLIRDLPPYRREAFEAGLRECGYQVTGYEDTSSPDNLLVIWNRYSRFDIVAKRYEQAGCKVLVAENGYLGRDWRDEHWYAMALSAHNGAGKWRVGDESRWDNFHVELPPWRDSGKEVVVLATRHIGVRGIAEPFGWVEDIVQRIRRAGHAVRVRPHPGEFQCVPLDQDLQSAKAVVSWGSGAALKAMMWGIPAVYGFKNWIGRDAATPLEVFLAGAVNKYRDRLAMFRRLAWAMWTTEEIATGGPFRWLLKP